jgi:hypothetical protein
MRKQRYTHKTFIYLDVSRLSKRTLSSNVQLATNLLDNAGDDDDEVIFDDRQEQGRLHKASILRKLSEEGQVLTATSR